ncbi:MAG: T9SS type A sorting domain-containing protein [Bacteroidetes bacterium]|nr:T9SS type A sorting domain-containing protein [Bacteroidota bacterium]
MFRITTSLIKKPHLILFLISCSSLLKAQTGSYKALDFDGSTQYVVVADNSALNSDSTITVEAWINAGSYGTNSWSNSIFCKHGWGSGNQGYVLRCGDNGKLSFNLCNSSGAWTEAISASLMTTGKWYHVAGTFDGDTISCYINGVRVAYTLYSGSIRTSNGLDPRIGDLSYGGGRYFDGSIDEVRVWSTCLEGNTLKDFMCRKADKSHPYFKNLAGYWKLDEGSGTSAKDETGNSTKSALTNGPTWILSGAAIGDVSAYTYSGDDVSLSTKFGDVFHVKDITSSSAPEAFQVFAAYEATEQGVSSGVNGTPAKTHYYGIYSMNPTNPTFRIVYDYSGTTAAKGKEECGIDMFQKTSGYQGSWNYTPSRLYDNGDSLVITNCSVKEYVVAMYETDSTKILSSSIGKPWYCGTNAITLTASASDSFSFVWYLDGNVISGANGNTLSVDSVGKYSVKVTRNNSSCSFSSSEMSISHKPAPSVAMGALTGVCEDVDSVGLTTGSPAGGIYSGSGVIKNTWFSPSSVGGGNYKVTYSMTDTNNCTGYASQTMTVYSLPDIKRIKNMEECDNQAFIPLNHHSPTGGTYTGKWVYNNNFRLDSAGYPNGWFPFVYSYTDTHGCSNSYKDSIKIKSATPCTFPAVGILCSQDNAITLQAYPKPGTYTGTGINNDQFDPAKAGAGKHTIIYSFTNQLNCTTTDTQVITVKANSAISWSQSIKLCQNGDSIKLTGGTPTGGYFSGTGVTNGGSFNPKGLTGGKYAVTYNFKDTAGCVNKTSVQAEVLDTAVISYTPPKEYCRESDSISLTKVVTSPAGTFTGPTVKGDYFYPAEASYGMHHIFFTHSATSGCVSKTDFMMTILKPDSVSLSLPDKMCTEDNAAFASTYPAGGTLKGNGIIAGLFSPQSAGEGNHLITYQITGQNGCKAIDSAWVLVGAKPDVKLMQHASVCEKDNSFLLTGGTPVDGGTYYIDGVKNDEFNPGAYKTGNHTIRYTVINAAGCKDSTERQIRVNPNPTKPGITQTKNSLKSSSPSGNQWYNLSGKISGATDRNYDATESGSYYVVVSTDSGCTNVSDTFAFTYVSVRDFAQAAIRFYPNPANESVIVTGVSDGTLEITDLNGRVIITQKIIGLTTELNTQELPAGTYLLRWSNGVRVANDVLMVNH